nr:hypothetical protein [Tanacetum cinerariifolium]
MNTRYKGKEIAKPITPLSETASEEDIDPKQAQRDNDMQKNLALIAKYFKKIYKPINNNLRTSSNSKNKNVDTTPRYNNDDHSGQFGTQRTVNVTSTREKVGSQKAKKGSGLRVPQGEDVAGMKKLINKNWKHITATWLRSRRKSLVESISVRDSCLVVLQTKQAEFERFKAFIDCTIDYDKLE